MERAQGPARRDFGRRIILSLALLVSVCGAASGDAQNAPEGTWVGEWVRDGSRLRVEMTFVRTAPGYGGSFSSSQLGVVGIPLSEVAYDAPRIQWKVVGDETTAVYSGTVSGGALAGEFVEGGAHGTFSLVRGRPEDAGVRESDVTFENGGVTLRGTVVSPEAEGPFPGVVFLHGSGPEGRWANRYLAHAFARRGIVGLIFDKRGVGQSTGDWRHSGFADLVADAAAAVEALRSQPQVLRDRVGIFGHSQGATIAPWVAVRDPNVAFVIAAAAGGVSMQEMEIFSLEHALNVTKLQVAQQALARKYIRTLVATAYDGAPRARLESVWREVRGYPWAFQPPAPSDPYWSFSRQIATYDPLGFWRQVTAPTLLLYGARDARVPPRRSAARIAQAYLEAEGRNLQVIVLPNADHSYRLPQEAAGKFAWPRYAPGYPERVIDWVLEERTAEARSKAPSDPD